MITEQVSENFLTHFWHKIELFFINLDLDSVDVIYLVSYFGIGFLCGLLLKHYVKYFILFLVFAILLLSTLHYFEFIVINEAHVKAVLGFSETETFNTIIASFMIIIRTYVIEVGVVVLGCLLGFKVG